MSRAGFGIAARCPRRRGRAAGAARPWLPAQKITTRPARTVPEGSWGESSPERTRSERAADADQERPARLVDLAGDVRERQVVAGVLIGEVEHVERQLRLRRQPVERIAGREVELAAVLAEVLGVVQAALVVAERALRRTFDPVVRQADGGDVVLPVGGGVPHHRGDAEQVAGQLVGLLAGGLE